MKTIKVFLSQPMNDFSNDEIIKERDQMISKCRKFFESENVEFISSFTDSELEEAEGVAHKNLWYLGRAIQLLADADYICRSPNWLKARGCKVETYVARVYGVTILNDFGVF